MVPGSPWESPLRTRGMEGQSRGLYTCHPPVHIMLGVEEPALLPDALRREVGDGAEQPVHAEVMRVGQPVALGQPEVGNLEQSGEEGAGQVWLTASERGGPAATLSSCPLSSVGGRSPPAWLCRPLHQSGSQLSRQLRSPSRWEGPAGQGRIKPEDMKSLMDWEKITRSGRNSLGEGTEELQLVCGALHLPRRTKGGSGPPFSGVGAKQLCNLAAGEAGKWRHVL